MAQQFCKLSGLTFSYNPQPYSHKQPTARAYNPTLTGGYIVDYGVRASDATITCTWATMDLSFYGQLDALRRAGGPMPFIDPAGTPFTVAIMDFGYDHMIAGGDDAVAAVVLVLQVISQP